MIVAVADAVVVVVVVVAVDFALKTARTPAQCFVPGTWCERFPLSQATILKSKEVKYDSTKLTQAGYKTKDMLPLASSKVPGPQTTIRRTRGGPQLSGNVDKTIRGKSHVGSSGVKIRTRSALLGQVFAGKSGCDCTIKFIRRDNTALKGKAAHIAPM